MIKATIGSFAPVGKKALFAVDISDDNGNSHSRVVPLTHKSIYQAELLAIKYVCESVADKNTPLVLETSLPYVSKVLEKNDDGWVKLSSRKRDKDKNALVETVRSEIDKFKSFELKLSDSNPLKDLIKKYS